jgi:hypothetical protein
MDETRRNSLGVLGLVAGAVLVAGGVIWTHYANFPQTEVIAGVEVPVEVAFFGWIPRGFIVGDATRGGIPWFTVGHITAFVGSQLALVGALLLWVADRPMTWPRAVFAAFIAWLELVLIFGTVASEWLNLAQGPLAWTGQRIAFTVPDYLVLGQDVAVSYSAIKDIISMTYNTVALAAALLFAYKIQDWGKPKPPKEEPERFSPYGRPLVRGS